MVAASQRQEAVDDGMRVLSLRKHALVILRHQRHAMTFKPTVGILVVKPMKQTFHQPMSTRINLRQVADLGKRIGTVTAPAATDLHFRQHPLAPLKDGYVHLWHHLLQVDSQKESCCSAANYRCLHTSLTFSPSFIPSGSFCRLYIHSTANLCSQYYKHNFLRAKITFFFGIEK